MKKKLFIGTIAFFILACIVVVLLYFLAPRYNAYKKDQIVKGHLKEINACIKRNEKFNKPYEHRKKHCKELYLFLYDNTKKKINYAELAEFLRFEYSGDVNVDGIDNKTLIKSIVDNYPSLKGNITGLD